MLKSESYGADFSFDRICLIPSICRHQSSIQDLLAFLQPFNVLPYGAIHKVAPRIRGNVRFKPILFPNQACCTLEAVLSHTPNSAPVRRFSFAGEQQDSDTAIRIVRPIFIEPEMPRGSGSAQFEIHRSSQGNKTCGRLSACQKNEQKPIKRSGKQTDWKIRNLAVPRRIAKRNRPARTSARLLWVVAVLRRDHAFVGRFSSSAIHSNSSLTTGLSGKAVAVSMAFASSGVSLVKCGALYFFLRPDSESGVDVLGSDGSFRMALWSVLNNYSLWTAREPRL